MIKLTDLLLENRKLEYGCVLLNLYSPGIFKLHQLIKSEDIYIDPVDPSFGLEKEPHCTLLFGLHQEVTDDQVFHSLKEIEYSDCILHNLSIFPSEKYDVLKFDVRGKGLSESNKRLSELPHTSTYPQYHPHCTVAYLKKGTSDKYVARGKQWRWHAKKGDVVYSKTNGTKVIINL